MPFASATVLQGAMGEECVSLISPKSQISVCSRDAQGLRSEEMSVAGEKMRFDIVGDVRIGSYRVQQTIFELFINEKPPLTRCFFCISSPS